MAKKPALGKGLGALLQDSETDITSSGLDSDNAYVAGTVNSIPIVQIEANPFQPRTKFEKDALSELSASIKELGVIQPITVRKLGYDKYQIISGERRFRASQLAGLKTIPAFVRIANDQEMLEMALVENIQREDLDAIEVALSYDRLINECKLTQEELSERVGKKRSTISNYLRLLNLPAEIQQGIIGKQITMGHARALISIEDENEQLEVFHAIIANGMSVRQVEEITKRIKEVGDGTTSEKNNKSESKKKPLSFTELKLKSDLTELFQTKVEIQKNNNDKGKIVIPFKSKDDLERIAQLLQD